MRLRALQILRHVVFFILVSFRDLPEVHQNFHDIAFLDVSLCRRSDSFVKANIVSCPKRGIENFIAKNGKL